MGNLDIKESRFARSSTKLMPSLDLGLLRFPIPERYSRIFELISGGFDEGTVEDDYRWSATESFSGRRYVRCR